MMLLQERYLVVVVLARLLPLCAADKNDTDDDSDDDALDASISVQFKTPFRSRIPFNFTKDSSIDSSMQPIAMAMDTFPLKKPTHWCCASTQASSRHSTAQCCHGASVLFRLGHQSRWTRDTL